MNIRTITLHEYNHMIQVPMMKLGTGEEVRVDPQDVILIVKSDYEALVARCTALEAKSDADDALVADLMEHMDGPLE